jgi:hypothetical protein
MSIKTRWKVIDYFDVWGNAEDGWEVNARRYLPDPVVFKDWPTDEEILEKLKTLHAVWAWATLDEFEIDGRTYADSIVVYDAKDSCPLFSFEHWATEEGANE